MGVSIYFFKVSQNHEQRIQKVEDIFSIKFEHLMKEIDDMKHEITNLTTMVNKQANNESNMKNAVDLLLQKLLEKQ